MKTKEQKLVIARMIDEINKETAGPYKNLLVNDLEKYCVSINENWYD